MTVLSVATATILAVLFHRSLQLVCPHGWTYLNERCWSYSHELRTWQKARDDCFRYGADLASISDEQENRFLRTLIADQLETRLAALTLNGFRPHRAQANDLTCFEKFPDSALVGLAEVALEDFRSVDQCLQECLRASERYNFLCLSVMWYRERFECILNSDTRRTNAQFFTSTAGSGEAIDYYENNCFSGGGGGGGPSGGGNGGGGGGVDGGGTGIERCFQKFPNSILVGYADLVVKDITVQVCLQNCKDCQNCIEGQPCKAVMYFREYRECILIMETRKDFPKDFVTDDGEADYYEPKPNCDELLVGGGNVGGGVGPGVGGGGVGGGVGGGGACPNQQIDALFVVDSSGSIGPIDFNNIRSFLNLMVDYLDISPNRSQVGLVSFNDDAFTDFHLNSYQTKEQIKAAIEGVGWRNGHTKLGNALQYSLTKELLRDQGDRPNAKNVILVLTDGLSQDNPSPSAQIMRNRGMTTFAVGITDAVNDEQLKNIAGSPDRVYKTRDFNSLDERLREQIMQQICAGEIVIGLNDVNGVPVPLPTVVQRNSPPENSEVALRDPHISITQMQLNNGVWLGAKLLESGSFGWVDGSKANFTKWKFGQPDRQKDDGCVVSAFEPLQQWSDVPCNMPHGFVCVLRPRITLNQKLQEDFSTSAPPDTTQSLSTQTTTAATTRTAITTIAKTTGIITTGITTALSSSQSSSTAQTQSQARDIRRRPPIKLFPSDAWTQFDSVLPQSRRTRVAQPRPAIAQARRPSPPPKRPPLISSEFPQYRKSLRAPKLQSQRRRTRQRVWDLRRKIYVYQWI